MPKLLSTLVLTSTLTCSTLLAAGPYDAHKVVRVQVETPEDLDLVLGLTDDVWSHRVGVGGPIDVRLAPDAYQQLSEAGLIHEVLIDDVGEAIRAERQAIEDQKLAPAGVGFFENHQPRDEINAYIEGLAQAHPELMDIAVIGQSIEGREIWNVRISAPGDATGKPDVAITGCQHAREWVSPMTVTYLIDRLVSLYDADPTVTTLLDNVEFHIIPIVNPDGYVYSWIDEETRLWRKNRRDNPGTSCDGVDLNRNWAFEWGGEGSSSDPCSQIYRGAGPLSEPESQQVASYLASLEDLEAHIDYHSYSQLILSPWGYTDALPDEATLFDAINSEVRQAIFDVHGETYTAGPSYTTIYPAAGVIPDYVFGGLGAWSWTIELRPTSSFPGFLLPPEEILPTAQENLPGMLAMAMNVIQPLKIVPPEGEFPATLDVDEAMQVEVDVYEILDSVGAEGVKLMTRVGPSGEFESQAMAPSGQFTYSASVSSASCGLPLQLFIETTTQGGQTVTYPSEGANDPISIDVIQVTSYYDDDAEVDLGWTVGAAGDTASAGIWELGDPDSTSSQPGNDHTIGGSLCWVTGADAGGSSGANDVDDGATTLTSPVFAAGPDADLTYWRWYSNDKGNAPDADSMSILISNDGGQNWSLLEEVTQSASIWIPATFHIADVIEPTDLMRLRFVASDFGDGSLVEAAVDDISVSTVGCSCPPGADFNDDGALSILDFVAFQASFAAQDPCADLNGDGSFSVLDFIAFQSLFGSG